METWEKIDERYSCHGDRAEALLFAKTQEHLVDRVIDFVKARHPYHCPAIVATPIVAGNPDYLAWIEKETGEE